MSLISCYFSRCNCRRAAVRSWAGLFFVLGALASANASAGLSAAVTLQAGAPTSVRPGEITTLEITLANNNAGAEITGTAFSNSLPGSGSDSLQFAGTPSLSCYDPVLDATITGSGTLTTSGTQGISLSGGVVPQRNAASSTDGTCTILIPVTPVSSTGAATNYTYTIASGAVTGNDGSVVSNVGSVSQSINITSIAQPTLTKSFSSSVVVLGGASSTLSITVSNPNPVALANFSISDTFPAQGAGGAIIEVASPTGVTSTCTGSGTPASTAGIAAGATSISVAGGTVAANGSCTVTVEVVARHTNSAYQTSNLANTINAVSDFSNDIGIRAQANASANIRARSPLGLSKSFSPAALASGQSGTMTIVLSNAGSSALTVQSFTDEPIDGIGNTAPTLGIKVNGAVSTSCSAGGAGTYAATTNNIGITQSATTTIAAGGSCTITTPIIGQTLSANTPVTYTNSIPAGAVAVGDPAIVSQNRSATLLVADTLRILKSRDTNSPRPGNPVRYSVTVQNWSSAAMSDVSLQETLANGMTFLASTINGNDFSPLLSGSSCSGLTVNSTTGSTNVDLVIGSVPSRTSISQPGQCVLSFYVMTDPGAANGSSTNNTLAAGSVCTAGFCNGGGASSGSSPVVSNPLTISKAFAPAGPLPEGTITRMSISLQNYSANALSNLSVSDTLPISGSVQMQVANPANATTDCGPGSITALPGSTSVALNGGSIAARGSQSGVVGAGSPGSCSVQVDVVGAAGVYTNTATATGNETYANGSSHTLAPIQASAPFTYNSILAASKTFSPDRVSSGGQSRVVITLNNTGPTALPGVSLTDPLPAGMVLASPANAYTTCGGSTAISAPAGGNSIALTGATIAGSGHCELVFDVLATGSSDWVNTIPVGNIAAASSGIINQSAVSATLRYVPATDLSIVKVTNPSNLTFPGETSRLTITVTNGSQAVSNLAVTDYFTADGTAAAAANGMVLTASPAATTNCPGATVAATAAGSSLGISGGSLAAGASCDISANVSTITTGGITNFIPVGAIRTSEGLSNAGQATTSLTTQTNLGISKQFTPDVIKIDTRSRLRITLYNPTPRVATSLSVSDNLPAGVTIPAGPNPQTTCTGAVITTPAAGQLQVSGGNLPPGTGTVPSSCYIEIDVTSASDGVYNNEIPRDALSGIIDGITVSNPQPARATLRVQQPLVVHKSIGGFTLDAGNPAGMTTGSASRAPGATATLVVQLENPNSTDLTQAAFTDTLPTGLVVAATPAASSTCTGAVITAPPSATNIGVTGATIPAAASCSVSVDVLSNISGDYINHIASGGISTLEGISNEQETRAQLTVSYPPQLSKQFAPAVIPPAGTATLTVGIGNDNSTALTLSADLIDTLPTLPGAITVASPANVSGNCGTVTATPGAGTVRLASGSTVPAGGCSFSVDVTGSTPGTHNNNIPAGALKTDAGDNQTPANAELLVSTQGFISGRVFTDGNAVPDGIFQPTTDTPLSGETIELHNGSSCAGTAVQSVVTDGSGNYLFHSLPAATYSVCQPSQPGGTVNGITTAGAILPVLGSDGTPGTASGQATTPSQITQIIINGNGTGGAISGAPNNDFAEIVLSSLSGNVFVDLDNDGVINGLDTGIVAQTVELLDNSGATVGTTTTDASGYYQFANLAPGTYSLRQPNQPPGTSSGITSAGPVANGGTPGSATGSAVLPSRINSVVLPPNTHSPENNFGEISNGKSISGRMFLDFDDSGTLDGPDYGIGGELVDLSGTDINGNPVVRQTTTGGDGRYLFTGLPLGSYTVTQNSQPAGTSNGATIVGSTGTAATDRATTPSAISGIDLAGVPPISAANNFAEVPDVAPDLSIDKTHTPASFGAGSSTGYFTLTPHNIGAADTSGTVTVSDALPAGLTLAETPYGTDWSCTGTTGGSTLNCSSNTVIVAGGSASDIVVRVSVAASAAEQILTNTATVGGGGEPPAFNGNNSDQDTVAVGGVARINGTVWSDNSDDGIVDSDERRLFGWRVELLLGGVVVASAQTAGDGTYSLDNIAAGGGYSLVFRDPVNGDPWGLAVTNEQGLASNPGVRDDNTAPVTGNTGNPAGAVIAPTALTGLTLFAGDDIIEQSLPMNPDLIPVPVAIPTAPRWLLLLTAALLLVSGRMIMRRTTRRRV